MDSKSEKSNLVVTNIATGLLWLATAGLGLAAVYYLHSLSTLIYAILGGREFWVGSLIGQVSALIAGILWLVIIIITGEYYLKHAGEKKTWKIIAYVLGAELLIILIGFLTTGMI